MTEYFAGGIVDDNPPANGGDTGSIPGPGRIAPASEQLSIWATTTEVCTLWGPWDTTNELQCGNYWSPIAQSLCPTTREAHAPQLEGSPHSPQLE